MWWAFSKVHGWVVLDKTVPENRNSCFPEEFTFLRCRDWKSYQQGEQPWNYTEARRYLAGLNPEEAAWAEQELVAAQQEFDAQFVT